MVDRIVKVVLRGDVSGLIGPLTAASKSVADTANKMTAAEQESVKFRRGLTSLGGTAGRVGLAASAGMGLVLKSAIDWESAWTGVTKTVDGSAAQMAELEGQLRELARTLPASHTEIAAVAEAAGQLGVQRDSITSFTKTMIDLGETTNLTADEAATSIAQMANVMQTAPEDIDNLGAALVALGNDGASTERDIIQMAQRISGTGAQIGLAESDILAIANAAASMGVNVEAGGSAISRVFTELAKATASGGPKLEAFAKTAGMTGDEFVEAFGKDPAKAFASFTKGLDRVNKSGGDVFSILEQLGLSDVRVSQALLGMAASGDLLTDSLKLGSEAWRENTALAKEAEKRYGTTASEIQVAWNNIKDASIDFGEVALPMLADVAGAAANVAQAFGDLPTPVQQSGTALLGITAAAGGSVWAFSKVVDSAAGMRETFADLGVALSGANKKMLALRGGAAALGLVAAGAAQMGDESTAAGRSLELLGTTASGALLGFAAGGPIGAAIGGGAGLLLNLATSAHQSGDAMDRAEQPTLDFASSLDQVSGAATRATRSVALMGLQQQEGAIESARAIGISSRDLVGYLLGNEAAIRRVNSAMRENGGEVKAWVDQYGITHRALVGNQADVERVRLALGILGDQLDEDAQKVRENALATERLGEVYRGVPKEVITEIRQLGGELSLRQIAELTKRYDLTPKQVRTMIEANNLTATYRDVLKLIESLKETDRQQAHPSISVDDGQALSAIERIKREIAGIKDKDVRITAYVNRVNAYNKRAGGGSDGDPNTPYSGGGYTGDRPVHEPVGVVHGREFVFDAVSTERAGVDNLYALQRRLRGYRTGGFVSPLGGELEELRAEQGIRDLLRSLRETNKHGRHTLRGLDRDVAQAELREARKELRQLRSGFEERKEKREAEREQRRDQREDDLRSALDSLTTATRDATAARDEVLAKMGALSSSVASGLTSDLFGPSVQELAWLSPEARAQALTGDVFAKLDADTAAGQRFNALQGSLAIKGLSGDALQALIEQGGLPALEAFNAMSGDQLAAYQAKFERRSMVIAGASQSAANLIYGPDLAASQAQVEQLTGQLVALQREHNQLQRQLIDVAGRQGAEFGRVLVDATDRGIRQNSGRR